MDLKRYRLAFFIVLFNLIFSIKLSEAQGGKEIFESKCAVCHTIGQGIKIGPDLKDVTKKREKDWLRRMIKEPDKMTKEDPIAIQLLNEFKGVAMPNFNLSDEEINLLLNFLESPATEKISSPQKEFISTRQKKEIVKMEDVLKGEALFLGTQKLANGGPPCISCHNLKGIRKFGGGKLGPDLSLAYKKYGEAGLSSILDNFPFPTMNPIYSKKLLTGEEKKYLEALLKSEKGTSLTYSWEIMGVVLSLFILLLIISKIIWQNRIKDVRFFLVQESINSKMNRR